MIIPLEKQVVSLELAKKMKELGFKQNSYFFHNLEFEAIRIGKEESEYGHDIGEFASAYTTAELIEMIPQGYCIVKTASGFSAQIAWGWEIKNTFNNRDIWEITKSEIAADAGAKLLIYLKESNLL